MLTLDAVCKSFYDPGRGEVRAVDGLSLSLTDGVTALVGANGAGKSTLLRLITTLLLPDSGSVIIDGLDSRHHSKELRSRLGYLSTTTRMYPRLSGRELLAYVGGFFGLYGQRLAQRIEAMDALFALSQFLDQRIDGLSSGQLQRINLARTLLADPDLLILDEPTTGLDLIAARAVVAAVNAARRPGRLIIIATHVLREVELTADQLLVMRAGRQVYSGPPGVLGTHEAFESSIQNLLNPGAEAQVAYAGAGSGTNTSGTNTSGMDASTVITRVDSQ